MRATARLRKGFEVEWVPHVPILDTGEADIDNATVKHRDFADIESARIFAKLVLDEDFFGSVAITPFEYVPFEPGFPLLDKEYTGDGETYEGD
jgi:hypothetical protein